MEKELKAYLEDFKQYIDTEKYYSVELCLDKYGKYEYSVFGTKVDYKKLSLGKGPSYELALIDFKNE